jgi:hypothetical protein
LSSLQIAFQHVWQEAIDKGAVHLAQGAYETIVELGGDPHRPEYENQHPLIALQSESGFALRAIRNATGTMVRDSKHIEIAPSTAPPVSSAISAEYSYRPSS